MGADYWIGLIGGSCTANLWAIGLWQWSIVGLFLGVSAHVLVRTRLRPDRGTSRSMHR